MKKKIIHHVEKIGSNGMNPKKKVSFYYAIQKFFFILKNEKRVKLEVYIFIKLNRF